MSACTLSLVLALILSGCGVAAVPCRIASAVIDAVPVVGHVAAIPTDACAKAIDP
jgi:DNA-binding transcriptional LysR family regulator